MTRGSLFRRVKILYDTGAVILQVLPEIKTTNLRYTRHSLWRFKLNVLVVERWGLTEPHTSCFFFVRAIEYHSYAIAVEIISDFDMVTTSRPKLKFYLFPLTRPILKKSPYSKNFISIFSQEFFFLISLQT